MNPIRAAGALLACALAALPGTRASEIGAADERELQAGSFNWSALVVSFENDKFFAGSDRHYTQGGRVTFLYDAGPRTWLTKQAQDVLGFFTPRVKNESKTAVPTGRGDELERGAAKLAVSLGQDLFTPENTSAVGLIPNDRPYAAWSYVAAGFHVIDTVTEGTGDTARTTKETSFIAELSLGIVGPSALGEKFQNTWHDVIGVEHSLGWDNQLCDEPGVNLAFEWRRKFPAGDWLDLVPRAAIVLGNVNTHASVGGTIRFGPGLPDDFGHDLIRAASGNVERTRGFVPYVFVSADVRLVGRNIFLDGNTWRDSHSVRKRPVVADVNAGFALNWPGFRLIYTQNYRTKEFHGQAKRDVFGSLSFAILF